MAEDLTYENPSELPEDLPDEIQETCQKSFSHLKFYATPIYSEDIHEGTHLTLGRAHEECV